MRAQNAFRLFEPRIGIAVGLIDALKGALVIFLARLADMSVPITLLSGILAVMGHNCPVFLHFSGGGRGEAVTIRVLLILMTWPMLIAGVISLLTLFKQKTLRFPACHFSCYSRF